MACCQLQSSEYCKAWALMLLIFWYNFATSLFSGKRMRELVTMSHELWNHNQNFIHAAVSEARISKETVSALIFTSPIPAWQRSFPEAKETKYGYMTPIWSIIAAQSCVINLWKRQWGIITPLYNAVLEHAAQALSLSSHIG